MVTGALGVLGLRVRKRVEKVASQNVSDTVTTPPLNMTETIAMETQRLLLDATSNVAQLVRSIYIYNAYYTSA